MGRYSAAGILWAAWVGVLAPADAGAQTGAADIARWDATVLAGSHLTHGRLAEQDLVFGNEWFHTAEAAVAVGRRWSPHIKTELTISATSDGRQFTHQFVQLPGIPQPVPVAAEIFTSGRQLSATVAWQFFENQWVHPFVEGGLVVDVARVRTDVAPQRYYTGDPRLSDSQIVAIDGRRDGPATLTRTRGAVGAGVKMYATTRLFIRADTRAVLSSRLDHLMFRAGIGIDF